MSRTTTAVEPKRERGRLRVAAIMQEGSALFAEKGFDAATMTEIAARSGTAIGSLYRFFPTKESLAEALIQRYGERLFEGLDEIVASAGGLSGEQLADRLVDLMLDLRQDRAVALALVDAQEDGSGRRAAVRTGTLERIASALVAQNAARTKETATAMAPLLLHLLKSVPLFSAEEAERSAQLIGEVRKLAGLYLGVLR